MNNADAIAKGSAMYAEAITAYEQRNYFQAIRLCRRAAKLGIDKAQRQLGYMHFRGHGAPQNYVKAYKWLSLATALGHVDAEKNRDQLAKEMTKKQIATAQQLARLAWRRLKPLAVVLEPLPAPPTD